MSNAIRTRPTSFGPEAKTDENDLYVDASIRAAAGEQSESIVTTIRKQCYPYPFASRSWISTRKHPFGRYRPKIESKGIYRESDINNTHVDA